MSSSPWWQTQITCTSVYTTVDIYFTQVKLWLKPKGYIRVQGGNSQELQRWSRLKTQGVLQLVSSKTQHRHKLARGRGRRERERERLIHCSYAKGTNQRPQETWEFNSQMRIPELSLIRDYLINPATCVIWPKDKPIPFDLIPKSLLWVPRKLAALRHNLKKGFSEQSGEPLTAWESRSEEGKAIVWNSPPVRSLHRPLF